MYKAIVNSSSDFNTTSADYNSQNMYAVLDCGSSSKYEISL